MTFEVLALAGSLRAASINAALCRAAVRLAPPGLRVTVFPGLGDLPLFNPDLEADPPPPVQALRSAVGRAHALLIASPEYAHGIAGPMKNALDWLVSFEGTVGKPVALFNASPRARHADEALREVLQTMSATVVLAASPTLPLLGGCTTEEAMLGDPGVSQAIRSALDGLETHLAGDAAPGASFPLG